MKKRLRILEVVGSMNAGGAETLLMNLVRAKPGDVQIDFLENTPYPICAFDDELREKGCAVYRVRKYRLFNFLTYRASIERFFKKNSGKWDIVHGHISSSSGIYLRAAKKAGFLTVMHTHSAFHGKGLRGLYMKHVAKAIIKYSDGLMTCGREAALRFFGKEHGEKAQVLRNGVVYDNFLFSPKARETIRQKLGIPENGVVLGSVGRLVKAKNYQFIIRVCRALNQQSASKEYHIVLVGAGDLMEELKSLAGELGVESLVHFEGQKMGKDLALYYSSFDLFVLPSLYEGLPVVISEALINGLKVIASTNVPRDAKLNNNVSFLPASSDSDVLRWAATISSFDVKREYDPEMKNYDVQNTWQTYEKYMLDLINQKRG